MCACGSSINPEIAARQAAGWCTARQASQALHWAIYFDLDTLPREAKVDAMHGHVAALEALAAQAAARQAG